MVAPTELIGCPNYIVTVPGPATLSEKAVDRLGWRCENTVGSAVSSLWEVHPVYEWTPGLMGSVDTKLLRKENPSQASHFTFYFNWLSHSSFSSAGFRGASWRVQWDYKRAKKGHLLARGHHGGLIYSIFSNKSHLMTQKHTNLCSAMKI